MKGKSSTVTTKEKATTTKGKEKVSEDKATIFVDLYQDAQYPLKEIEYLDWLNQ